MTEKQAYKSMFTEYPDVLNIEDTSKILEVSTKTAYKLLKENKIMFLKIGREYRVPKINLIKYLLAGDTIQKR